MVLQLIMILSSRIGKDQPIELHSEEYTDMNYYFMIYEKAPIVFDYLMAYLGEDLYDECMRTYFEKWKFKHPGPKDIQSVFEEKTGKNLDWFFDDILKTTKHIDYAITDIKEENENYIINIKNKGKINSPLVISGVKNGESQNPTTVGLTHCLEIRRTKNEQ